MHNLPDLEMPEVVLAGKSNVGKSSLINHLFCRKNIARVSSTPGKTKTLNYFIVDEKLAFIDLPGYGFAKRPKKEQEEWVASLESYFKTRQNLALILLLIDIRRGPDKDDISLMEWAKHFGKPVLIVLTKSDTIVAHERKKIPSSAIYYSIKDAKSRTALISKINEALA